jgi:hypothetical protein
MRNMLRFRGIELSEAMCFGLGSGAGFIYLDDLPVPPFAAVHGRILEMERELCETLALAFPEHEEKDADTGWEKARQAVAQGNPVLINTDLAYLDYFETNTHFTGHRVVLFGFDDEKGEALISDSEREEPQWVSGESLKRARSSALPPYPMGNRWCVLSPSGPPRSLARAIPHALRKNAADMLSPAEGDILGIAGIRKAAEMMPGWPGRIENWRFAARFGYQVIEKRGTGGGFFRRMYARYLEEASSLHPLISKSGLPGELIEIADKWTEAAAVFKAISESENPMAFEDVSALFREQAQREETFWKKVLEVSSTLNA